MFKNIKNVLVSFRHTDHSAQYGIVHPAGSVGNTVNVYF